MPTVFAHLNIFFSGIAVTLSLTAIAGMLSLAGGLVIAVMRISPVPVLRTLGAVYVEIFRNTPLTIQFFFVAFVLPSLGVSLSYFIFAVIALSVYYTAFFAEAIRAGCNGVAIGQAEAARSIGLTFFGALRLVVLPQALRTVIPPLINVFIALVKSTAIASAFGVAELLTVTEQFANDHSRDVLPALFMTACFYLAITIPAGLVAAHIERRMAFAR
ncbi:amino acid ABC transporter permease [Caballeronia sp. DA-9]|uniref:amino acid ABC transporter permease n=1 Tax=Caballeronia sp. DA-9 TaxID=3436237 RepID=UPI003F66120C